MNNTPAEVSDATMVYCLNLLKAAPKCRKAEQIIRAERLRLKMRGDLPAFNPISREPKLPFLRRLACLIGRIDKAISKYDNRAWPEWVHEAFGFGSFVVAILVASIFIYATL